MEDKAPLMKKIMWSFAGLALAAVLATAGVRAVGASPEEKEEAKKEPMTHDVVSFDLEGFNDKGARTWDVKGKSATMVEGGKVKMSDIVANTYGSGAQATISAANGEYDKTNNTVRLKDDVSANITYVDSPGKDIPGFPFDAQAGKQPEASSKNQTVITCDGEVEFNYESNVVYFRNAVKVKSSDGDIDADMITVYLDPKTKQIDKIVAEGNVRISRGENTTFSEKATYLNKEKRVVLTGSPKLVFYQEEGFTKDLLQ